MKENTKETSQRDSNMVKDGFPIKMAFSTLANGSMAKDIVSSRFANLEKKTAWACGTKAKELTGSIEVLNHNMNSE